MKRILTLLLAVCLLLCGCQLSGGGSVTTKPTFSTDLTPQQILSAAADKTAGASSFQLTCVDQEGATLTVTVMKSGKGYTALGQRDCGCSFYVSGATRVHLQCQTGQIQRDHITNPYTLKQVLEDLPTAESGLWQRLEQFPLMAELLGDGSTRYGAMDLRYAEMRYLLTGMTLSGSNEENDGFDGYFFVTVDASGYMTAVEFKSADQQNPTDYSIKIEKLNQKMTIDTPWWAEE